MNKGKVVVVVGGDMGLQLCVHVCLCVYKGVRMGEVRGGSEAQEVRG